MPPDQLVMGRPAGELRQSRTRLEHARLGPMRFRGIDHGCRRVGSRPGQTARYQAWVRHGSTNGFETEKPNAQLASGRSTDTAPGRRHSRGDRLQKRGTCRIRSAPAGETNSPRPTGEAQKVSIATLHRSGTSRFRSYQWLGRDSVAPGRLASVKPRSLQKKLDRWNALRILDRVSEIRRRTPAGFCVGAPVRRIHPPDRLRIRCRQRAGWLQSSPVQMVIGSGLVAVFDE